jgi:hypothetical protein
VPHTAGCAGPFLCHWLMLSMPWRHTGGVAVLFLFNFGIRWLCMVSFMLWLINCYAKTSLYPSNRRLGRFFGREKISCPCSELYMNRKSHNWTRFKYQAGLLLLLLLTN